MGNRLILPAVICTLAVVFGIGCSKESAEVSTRTAAAEKPVADKSANSDDPVELAQADKAETETSESAAAYAEMLDAVRALERSSDGTQQGMMEMVRKMESMFKDFIRDYDGTVEAKDARFQLGLIYTTLQRGPEAVAYLREYIDTSEGENRDKVGYAHYYLAEALKASDRFEEARKHYEIFLNDFPGANPQAVAQARVSLEDLDTWKQLAIGATPIPFSVKDINGNPLNLEKLRGKVVLLDFWATWCGPCRIEMPNVVNVYKKYKDQGFEIVGVSLDQNRSAFDRYIEANNMSWRHFFDGRGWNNEIAMKYKIRSIPATFLLDREGKIRHRAIRGKQLEQAVAELVKETS